MNEYFFELSEILSNSERKIFGWFQNCNIRVQRKILGKGFFHFLVFFRALSEKFMADVVMTEEDLERILFCFFPKVYFVSVFKQNFWAGVVKIEV